MSSEAVGQSSLVEDLIDVFFSPAAMFTRRAGRPSWAAYAIVTVLLAAAFYSSLGALQGFFDAELMRAMADMAAKNPQLTADQIAGMQGTMEASFKYGGFVVMPFLLLVLGACVWLVAKILGGELGYGGGVMIASFAYLPKVLESLLVSVQSLVIDTSKFTGRYEFSWGVGRFLDPAMPQGMQNLLGRIDLFTLWTTLLIAVGLAYSAKVPKSKAYAGAAIVWGLGALPAVYQLISGK
jgi:hypothetical protein